MSDLTSIGGGETLGAEFYMQKKLTKKTFAVLSYTFVDLLYTLSTFFIPWAHFSYLVLSFIPCASVSYLGIIGIFSYLRHHFIPFECSFIPSMSVFSYLLGCEFIPKLFNFIPLARFFHTLGMTISYLLQSVSHPEQIYSYPNWTIHNPGWTFTIKLSYGSIGRHEWHTHPPANQNLVP